MAKKVFITGITGFAGSHLAEYLVSNDTYSISGTYLSEKSMGNVVAIKSKLRLVRLDLTDNENTTKLIRSIAPEYTFHLAALPVVGDSFKNPTAILINNVSAQINLLEAIKEAGLTSSRIVVVSSADVYGKVEKKDLPIDEETPFMPTNTYAVSKITQDYLGLQYFISYKLSIVRARPFNHIGPRQATGFVVADFAQKIAQIEKGNMAPILQVGNLETRRDFTDVRDMVRAYTLLIEKGKSGEAYNIGSGKSYKIGDILTQLVAMSKTKITIERKQSLFRPEDAFDRVCDTSKLKTLTGWQPSIPIEKTLEDTLEYWRNIV